MKHVKLFEQFTANEAYIGPFVFNDSMSDEELKAMYNDALSGYANWQKGFKYPKSDYKKVYQEIEKILKKRGVSIDEAVFIEFLNKDKNFKKDTKHFKSYDEAVKWAKANFDKFNPDMIKYESLKIDELRLTSYGVKDLLKAVNNRLDLLPQLGFDKFKDVIHHLKYGDQEEQNELRDKLKELGVNVAYESKVNEGELNSKVAKKLTIGDTIKTDKHTYTITDFGQKANAFRQFQVEDEAGEIYQIQVSLYGSNSIGVGAGRSLNFRDEVLEALGVNVVYESKVNEAKVIDRDEMIKWIQQYMRLVKTTEEFDGSTGGIWVSGENMDLFKGKRIYDYYNETRAYHLGVLSSWEKELDKRGWYSEWYDAGTVMIWQN